MSIKQFRMGFVIRPGLHVKVVNPMTRPTVGKMLDYMKLYSLENQVEALLKNQSKGCFSE